MRSCSLAACSSSAKTEVSSTAVREVGRRILIRQGLGYQRRRFDRLLPGRRRTSAEAIRIPPSGEDFLMRVLQRHARLLKFLSQSRDLVAK